MRFSGELFVRRTLMDTMGEISFRLGVGNEGFELNY